MKVFPFILSLVFAATGFAADSEKAPASLVPNGNFEIRSKGGEEWPEGWGSWAPGNGKTWQSENGAHFVRLVSQMPGQLQLLYREIKLPKDSLKAVSLTVRYRSADVKPGTGSADDSGALFLFRDSEGRVLNPNVKPVSFAHAAKDWTDATVTAPVPHAATQLVVMAGLFKVAAGAVDIAAITATPLSSDDAEKIVAAAPSETAPPESLITNGDFQKSGDQGDWPEGWGQSQPGITWEQEDGKRFMRIVSQSKGQMLTLSRDIPLKPGAKGVELTVRFRTSGVEFGEHEWFDARTLVDFLDAQGNKVEHEGGSLDVVFTHKPAATPWIEHTKSYSVPGGATQMRIRPGLFMAATGTVDIAEIRLVPLSDAATAMMHLTEAAYAVWKGEQNGEMERRLDRTIATQLDETGNLVPNGDFSAGDPDGEWPAGWGRGAPANLSWKKEGGIHFIHFTPSPEKVSMLYKMVLLNRGVKAVEVKIRYRTAHLENGGKLPGDAHVAMHFMAGGRFGHLEYGKVFEPDPTVIVFSSKAADWTDVSRRYLVPEGATKIQFMPGLWGVKSGTLDIAQIQVKPLGDADAAAMSAAIKPQDESAVANHPEAPPVTQELKVSGNKEVTPASSPESDSTRKN